MTTKNLPGIIAFFVGLAYLFCIGATTEYNYFIAPLVYLAAAIGFFLNKQAKDPSVLWNNIGLVALMIILPLAQFPWYMVQYNSSITDLIYFANHDAHNDFSFAWLGCGSILAFSMVIPIFVVVISNIEYKARKSISL